MARVRFTVDGIGLVRIEEPFGFQPEMARLGDEGELLEIPPEGMTVPDGWVMVDVGDGLFAPVYPTMIEPVT